MGDPVDVAGVLVWIAVIGAFLLHQAWARTAAGREAAGSCTRCGSPGGTVGGAEVGGGHMCERCRGITRRNYRAGFLFFVSVGALFLALVPVLVAVEYRRFGAIEASMALVLIAAVGALSVAMGLAIRHYGLQRLS